jgi:hypothetical protein
MGDDFTNRQVLLAGRQATRGDIVEAIRASMTANGFVEVLDDGDVDRRIAVGPEDRWLCVYDSVGNGDDWDRPAFTRLSEELSKTAPLVEVHMDDSAAVHLYLMADGQRIDQFANRDSVMSVWETPEEEIAHQGRPDIWAAILDRPAFESRLKIAWQSTGADVLLRDTADALGWNPYYAACGYSIDFDGVPVYFREYFADDEVDADGFTELHFRRRTR